MALIWGSSFLWIAIAIDDVAPAVVPLARAAFGFVALALIPAARRRLPRREYPRIVALGLIWMAIPFLLFPLAEQTTGSAVAGMINGALPVVTVAVTAIFARRLPSAYRVAAVTIGCLGVALVSLGSISSTGGADARGVLYLVAAVICYAVAVNIATPLQRRHGSLPVMLHVLFAAVLWSLPAGVEALDPGSVTWSAFISLLILGAIGTGAAFAIYGAMLARTGPVRGMIGTYFTPIVAIVLGVIVRDESVSAVALAGLVAILVGAAMTSRPDVVLVNAAARRRTLRRNVPNT